jgi:hypothetical protein
MHILHHRLVDAVEMEILGTSIYSKLFLNYSKENGLRGTVESQTGSAQFYISVTKTIL